MKHKRTATTADKMPNWVSPREHLRIKGMDLLKIKSIADVQRTLRTNPLALAEPLWQLIQQHHALKLENQSLRKVLDETADLAAQNEIALSNAREAINDKG